ncbi:MULTISPECIES: DUF3592 domain-containing protein [unclassified Photobacterium]|uniref:DUF3592 domain-containing protein n=1 Tax=unclassified Photobacterium TaxID=2628852 RepID=UPI001EE12C74|nr:MULTISPECIES: DUF3592 domain-containing protein [unclassified Photobacterium]MCG3866107.1 DUF3592 domain-containing protein [Photobacterium sp. Ph6]MCG3877600.1 DUF3592 domain-containing protein [Photobacterium sp. Ph5]
MNIVPLIAGYVFGVLGSYILFDYWRFNQKALKTKGKILRYYEYQSKDSDNSKQTMYRPSFEFSLNGITYEVQSKTSFNSKIIPIGQNTDILYHKGNEANARLAKGNGFRLGILFIGLSIPAIYIGLYQ